MSMTVVYQPGMQLGRSFDLKSYTTGRSIFSEESTAKTTRTERQMNNIKYSVIKGSSDVNSILGVSGDISLKCKAGILSMEGMGSYFREDRSQDNTVEIIARAQVETVTESMIDDSPLAGWSKGVRGTHFIRSIIYGGDLMVRIRIKGKTSKDFSKIEATVNADLKTGGAVDAGVKAKFKKMEDEIKDSSEVDIEYYSTTAKGEMPRDITGMLHALDNFKNEVIQLNEGRGVPCKVEILPLNMLDDTYPSVLKDSAFNAQMGTLEDKFDDVIAGKSRLDRFLMEDCMDLDLDPEEEETASGLEQRIDDARQSLFEAISEIDVISQKDAIPKISNAIKSYKQHTKNKPGGFRREVAQFLKKVSGKQMEEGPDLSIVMLGKTGHGKSSTGNTILGERRFESHGVNDTVTSKCQSASRIYENRTITVLDTPDTDVDRTYVLRKEINDFCLQFPPSALLLVLRWNTRMTTEEASIMKIIDEISSQTDLLNRTLLVFTYGDTFRPDVKVRKERRDLFRKHLEQQTGVLKDLMMRVGNRCILVNNMETTTRRIAKEASEIVGAIDSLIVNAKTLYVDETAEEGFSSVSSSPLTDTSHSVAMYDLKDEHASGWEMLIPGCFPASSRVILEGDEVIEMAVLQVGQKVLTRSTSGRLEYSEIYLFGHCDSSSLKDFITIKTENNIINVSRDHHIFINQDDIYMTIPASRVQKGMNVLVMREDQLEEDAVVDVAVSVGKGLYAPFTLSGTIVVDGVLASCYVDCVPPRLAHPLLWPVRTLYSISPSVLEWISRSKTDGIPNWIKMFMEFVLNKSALKY